MNSVALTIVDDQAEGEPIPPRPAPAKPRASLGVVRRERSPLESIAGEVRDLQTYLYACEHADAAERKLRRKRDASKARSLHMVIGVVESLRRDLDALERYVYPQPPFAEPDACGEAALSLAGDC